MDDVVINRKVLCRKTAMDPINSGPVLGLVRDAVIEYLVVMNRHGAPANGLNTKNITKSCLGSPSGALVPRNGIVIDIHKVARGGVAVDQILAACTSSYIVLKVISIHVDNAGCGNIVYSIKGDSRCSVVGTV